MIRFLSSKNKISVLIALNLVIVSLLAGCSSKEVNTSDSSDNTENISSEKAESILNFKSTPKEHKYGNSTNNIVKGGNFVDNGDFWYIQSPDKNLYKMDTNNNFERILISEEREVKYINVLDDWIYYVVSDKIFKISTDGENKTQLTDGDVVSNMHLVDDWIYYFNDNKGIYKIRLDGSDRTRILDMAASAHFHGVVMAVDGEWIYYTVLEGDMPLFKIRTDGTEKTKVNDDRVTQFYIVDDVIYYKNQAGIFMFLEGQPEKTEAIIRISPYEGVIADFAVVDDFVYYTRGYGSEVYKSTIIDDGSSDSVLTKSDGTPIKAAYKIFVAENYLIITGMHGDVEFSKIRD